jgi:hypothetical protein
MNNREQFINEIAEVVNRNSMEKAFNDTPDFILARIAVEAMEMFARASAHRDDFHEFRTADYEKKRNNILSRQKQEPAASCKGCPFTEICPDVKMKRHRSRNAKRSTRNRRRTTYQRKCKQWRLSLLICSPIQKYKSSGSI